MVGIDGYQLLQVAGLTLPFLSLYLMVLVEIRKLPKPIKGADLEDKPPNIENLQTVMDRKWVGVVNISYAHQHYDFVFILTSIMLALISALILISYEATQLVGLAVIGSASLALAFFFAAISIPFTLWFCFKHFSAD